MQCKTLKIRKLLCYKPLISTVLLIYAIDTQIYRYFHLKFLPFPWKSSLCLATVVKSREKMKQWEKLFLTEATDPMDWTTPSASQRQVGTGNQTILCTDCTALQENPCPCTGTTGYAPQNHRHRPPATGKSSAQSHMSIFLNSVNTTAKFKSLIASLTLWKQTESCGTWWEILLERTATAQSQQRDHYYYSLRVAQNNRSSFGNR